MTSAVPVLPASFTVKPVAGAAAAEGCPVEFTVALSGAVSVPVTVGWSTSDGTAAGRPPPTPRCRRVR